MRSKAFLGAWLASATVLSAQYARPTLTNGVTIEQKLNAQVPLDLVFRNEANQAVPLRTYFGDKPVILSLVYFKCPSLCPMSMHETMNALRRVPLEAGRDYNVLVVSFDPSDTPADARNTKAEYKSQFRRAGYDAGFHFLTGNQQAISQLTAAVGWRYHWDAKSKQFIHAGGIMAITPEGKLSRYFYGIDYAPADVRMALVQASQHRIGSPVNYILLFCLHYDPLTGKYTLAILNVLKLAAGLTVLLLGGLIFFLLREEKHKLAQSGWKEAPHAS
jgi:protein SCO1/2